jgi:hypothetical protein
VRCSFPCDLVVGGKTVEGAVRNLSESGIGIDAPLAAAGEGDSLDVTLKPVGRAPIDVQAHVWHERVVRRARGGDPFAQLGLVLAEARDDYFALVAALLPAQSAEAGAAPTGARFAVQVAHAGSSRTRRVLVVAPDVERAAARALDEAGDGWSVVEVRPARG